MTVWSKSFQSGLFCLLSYSLVKAQMWLRLSPAPLKMKKYIVQLHECQIWPCSVSYILHINITAKCIEAVSCSGESFFPVHTHTQTHPFPPQQAARGKPLVIRLSFPLVGSVIPESLCKGAKWPRHRQKVGSSHASKGGRCSWQAETRRKQTRSWNKSAA